VTSPTDFVVPIAEHLTPSIYEAVEAKLERACDNAWDDTMRIRVLEAARLWEGFMAKTLTPQQIAEVALLAVQWIQPHWPTDLEGIDQAEKLLAEARELIELHDRAITAVTMQR
jgi:hypothetical protein